MSAALEYMNRGNRHTRRLDGELAYVDARLEGWGRWAKMGVGLGWPPQSVYTKDRIIGAGPPPQEMPEHVLEVEKAILKLQPIERHVVTTYYVYWAPRETMARQLGLTVSRFGKVLNRSRWRVRDLLDGIE